MIPIEKKLNPLHVTVTFGVDISGEVQGVVLLALEKQLRAITGMDVRVFKDRMQDDSKLRRSMTQEQRNNL